MTFQQPNNLTLKVQMLTKNERCSQAQNSFHSKRGFYVCLVNHTWSHIPFHWPGLVSTSVRAVITFFGQTKAQSARIIGWYTGIFRSIKSWGKQTWNKHSFFKYFMNRYFLNLSLNKPTCAEIGGEKAHILSTQPVIKSKENKSTLNLPELGFPLSPPG